MQMLFLHLVDVSLVDTKCKQATYKSIILIYLLCASKYLAFSFLPPNRAAAAFLKKFLAGLDKWKSGTV